MDAFGVAFALVFVAELGDKSQLLALAFAARYPAWVVLVGIAVAAGLLLGAAALLGGLIGDRVSEGTLAVFAGLAFLGFAVWTLLDRQSSEEDTVGSPPAGRAAGSALIAVSVAFLLAEVGDKTMLATATLATRQPPVATWLGAVGGMVTADAIAVALGAALASRVPPDLMRKVSAGLFAAVGLALLAGALLSG